MSFVQLVQQMIASNPPERWLMAMGIATLALLMAWLTRRLILRRFRPIALRSSVFVDDALVVAAEATRLIVLVLPALYLGTLALAVPDVVGLWARTLAIITLLAQGAVWGSALIGAWVERYRERNLATNAAGVSTARMISFVARLGLYAVVVLLILDNIPGVQITPLIASLGIGGIAVGLAVQNILSDLFASLSIAFDKPFVLGDFIVVGDFMGTVEHIGLRSTRLKSISGEQLIFANNDLLSSRIRNFQRMHERRMLFTIAVRYETTPEQLRRIPVIMREAIEAQPQTRFDRAHFKSFGDVALSFEAVYFVLSPNYTLALDIQQAVNLTIIEQFAAANIDFVHPAAPVPVVVEPQGSPAASAT